MNVCLFVMGGTALFVALCGKLKCGVWLQCTQTNKINMKKQMNTRHAPFNKNEHSILVHILYYYYSMDMHSKLQQQK